MLDVFENFFKGFDESLILLFLVLILFMGGGIGCFPGGSDEMLLLFFLIFILFSGCK